jgi:hypothetical protein
VSQNISIEKLPGSATISASEKINCRYETFAGQSIPNATLTVVNFGVKKYDSHNAVTTGAGWNFRAPISGEYNISAMFLYQSAFFPATTLRNMLIRVNGLFVSSIWHERSQASVTTFLAGTGSTDINLLSGDVVSLVLIQESGAAVSLQPDALYNWVCIKQIK